MKGILTDITKCIGCRKCVDMCSETYGLGSDLPKPTDVGDGLSYRRWTTIVERGSERNFVRKFCRHCIDPACVSACIVGALKKTSEGPVIYDRKKCIGCRYCMMACPYGIPRYEWHSPVPYIRKCIFCYERIKEGKQPVCTEACPVEATVFGERDTLISKAEETIKSKPGKYIERVFGEREIGGTCVLYISSIDLDFLNWKGEDMGEGELPELTLAALSKVPWIASGVGASMLGIWWVIGRRVKLAERRALEERKNEESE